MKLSGRSWYFFIIFTYTCCCFALAWQLCKPFYDPVDKSVSIIDPLPNEFMGIFVVFATSLEYVIFTERQY